MVPAMKTVQGRVISSRPLPDEWDEEACLCQGKVPENKRIDIQHRIYDEKRSKWKWKTFVRYHIDCPIHGCNRESE